MSSKTEYDTSLYKIDNIRVLLRFLESTEDENAKKLFRKIQPIYNDSIQKLKQFFDEINKENRQHIEKYMSRCDDETKIKLTNLVDVSSSPSINEDTIEEKKILKEIINAPITVPHDWKVGSLLEARDRSKNGYDWYLSKIVEIKGRKCKIHFKNWNQRFDKWYDMNSIELRPWHEATELEKNSKFKIGEKVLAKNPDEDRYLPCRIDQMKTDNNTLYYSVLFYEMEFLKFLVKCDEVKKLNDEVSEIINGNKSSSDINSEQEIDIKNDIPQNNPTVKQDIIEGQTSHNLKASLKRKRSECSDADINELDLSIQFLGEKIDNVKFTRHKP